MPENSWIFEKEGQEPGIKRRVLESGDYIWLKFGHLLKVEKEILYGNERIWDIFILFLLFFTDLFSS